MTPNIDPVNLKNHVKKLVLICQDKEKKNREENKQIALKIVNLMPSMCFYKYKEILFRYFGSYCPVLIRKYDDNLFICLRFAVLKKKAWQNKKKTGLH